VTAQQTTWGTHAGTLLSEGPMMNIGGRDAPTRMHTYPLSDLIRNSLPGYKADRPPPTTRQTMDASADFSGSGVSKSRFTASMTPKGSNLAHICSLAIRGTEGCTHVRPSKVPLLHHVHFDTMLLLILPPIRGTHTMQA
jgi:hypothetical protein